MGWYVLHNHKPIKQVRCIGKIGNQLEGYWQQDVHYKIKANIDEKTDVVQDEETLVYTNNSPDELHFVYFHLYQNAFQPGSYCDDLHKLNKFNIKYGKYECERKGTEIQYVKINGRGISRQS